jgi:hypothetical protein
VIPAMIVAASTVAIVAIAAVVIVALLALIYILPPEADGAGTGFLGDGFWGQVRGFSGRLRALGGVGYANPSGGPKRLGSESQP